MRTLTELLAAFEVLAPCFSTRESTRVRGCAPIPFAPSVIMNVDLR
jgi:hypothetical protein